MPDNPDQLSLFTMLDADADADLNMEYQVRFIAMATADWLAEQYGTEPEQFSHVKFQLEDMLEPLMDRNNEGWLNTAITVAYETYSSLDGDRSHSRFFLDMADYLRVFE